MQQDRLHPLDTPRDHSQSTENENLKPGRPPRPATEPHGSEHSTKTPKTQTDPATGAPHEGAEKGH
jgi:hypothetical protein